MDLSKLSDADLQALQAGDLARVSDQGLAHLQRQGSPAPARASSVLDAPNAVATGANQGWLQLLGLPVDTVANVVDLAKAGVGSAVLAAQPKGNQQLPDWLQVGDRSKVIGSGDWLVKKAREYAAPLVTANNPEYEGGYLQAGGRGLSAIVSPRSRAELAQQALTGVVGSVGAKGAVDATGDPTWGVIASLLPHAATQAATMGARTAVRGGEEGRQAMAQRVADLQAAGVKNPTLGLASGNNLIGGVENLLANTPGSINIMRRAREDAVNGMQAKTEAAAAKASGNRGQTESGTSIQRGAKSFQQDFKERQGPLYGQLDNLIGSQTPVDVTKTRATLADLNADIPGAPQLSKQFKNARIGAIEDAVASDTAGAPASVNVFARPPVGGGGLLNAPVERSPLLVPIPEGPPRNTLPFEAVKRTRTLVGNEIADNSLMSDVPRSKWNPLYGALSEDMQGAATAAGPQAEQALNRANAFTRSGIARMERIAPIVDKPAPEQTFQALNRSLAENTSTFQAVKKSLPEGARGDFAGTVIERLGKATPGQQDSTGAVWSPETFLTNWNRMAPAARDELLSGFPNAAQVKADIQKVADAASLMRTSSKMWANPSGTSANAAARGTLGAIGAGAALAPFGLVSPAVPLAAAGGVGAANLIGRGLTSKTVRDAILRKESTSAPLTASDLALLANLPTTERQQR